MAVYRIRANLRKMESAAKKIRTEAGTYRRKGKELIQAVSSSQGWEGADAGAFRRQLAGFSDDLENMAKMMESYAAFLTEAANVYRTLQDTAVQQAKNLWW